MIRGLFQAVLTVGLTLAGIYGAAAQTEPVAAPPPPQPARTIYLYNASLGAPAPGAVVAKTGVWGNGSVGRARGVDYEGASVLEITTRNLQEGARFDLVSPVDIQPYMETGFLRLRLKFSAGRGGRGMRGRGQRGRRRFRANGLIQPQWNGAAQVGALPPLGAIGGFPALPGAGAPAAAPEPERQSTSVTEILVTMVREHGVTSAHIPVDLNKMRPDENGWYLFVAPVREMNSTPDASGLVSRIIITADSEDTFYMAQAALVEETAQMTVSIRPRNMPEGTQIAEITVKPGRLSLIADVEAGAADPAIEWNFDADNVGNLPPAAFGGGPAPATTDNGGPAGAPLSPAQGAIRPGGAAGGIVRIPAAPPDVMGPQAAPAGPRIDARGLTASFVYPNEEQNYRVEVTVRDRSGQKPTVTASLLVHVRG
jgi:hypothetical protein